MHLSNPPNVSIQPSISPFQSDPSSRKASKCELLWIVQYGSSTTRNNGGGGGVGTPDWKRTCVHQPVPTEEMWATCCGLALLSPHRPPLHNPHHANKHGIHGMAGPSRDSIPSHSSGPWKISQREYWIWYFSKNTDLQSLLVLFPLHVCMTDSKTSNAHVINYLTSAQLWGQMICNASFLLSIFARIPSYVCPSIAQSLVSSSPIWCDRSLQQTVTDGLPCGRLPYWGRLTIILEQCHVLFSRMWRPNPDATEEDIKNP